MKTLTNIRKTEKHLKALLLISLIVFQVTLKASEVPAATEEATEVGEVVEDWMLDLSSWTIGNNYYSIDAIFESEMEIEEWMTNPDNIIWETNYEEELTIEDWMYDVNHSTWNDCTNNDEEMPIESWMLDPSGWLK